MKRTTIRLTKQERKWLKEQAEKEDVSMAEVVRHSIMLYRLVTHIRENMMDGPRKEVRSMFGVIVDEAMSPDSEILRNLDDQIVDLL